VIGTSRMPANLAAPLFTAPGFIHERITAPTRDLVERRLARPVDAGTSIPISFAALHSPRHARRRRDVLHRGAPDRNPSPAKETQ
jgi:hypothetical protein